MNMSLDVRDICWSNIIRCSLNSLLFILLSACSPLFAQQKAFPLHGDGGRERLLLDFRWRFAFGHAVDDGEMIITASSDGLSQGNIRIQTQPAGIHPAGGAK